MSAKLPGELFYLLEKYRKSPSEDSLNQLETKLVAVGVPHEQIKTQLADLAASIETTTIDEEALTSEILGWRADANIENCNLAVYRTIVPIAKLMFAVEQNGIAIEHAYKLAVLFDDEKNAFAYLSSFIKSNPKVTQPLHDACLFSLPTGQLDLTIWRKLCSKHMNDEIFRHKILPRADVLEAYIKNHQKGKKIDFKAIAEQRKIIEKINAERKKLKRKHGTLTIPEKERLKSLSQQLIAAQKALVRLAPPFNHDLHLTTLQAFLKFKDVESVGALKYFLEHGLTEKDYAKFLALERKDDPSQIPNMVINGDEIGHPGFYLMKVDVMDDMQAARAACLGKLSNCCQSLSGEAGESCTIHGLTSPLGGFYVVCQGDVNYPQVNDPLLGQCWAWRSQSGAIVFDSIEAPMAVKRDINSNSRVARFYQALAVKLVNNNHTNKVACGASSGISENVGTRSVFNTNENFVDYAGYCDSSKQNVIADKERPYYGYVVDEQRTHETEKMISTFVRDEVVSQQSFEMLNWALLFNRFLDFKICNVLKTEAQLEKLTMLVKMQILVNKNDWNKETIEDLAAESVKNSSWASIRNINGMTPLMFAARHGLHEIVKTLLSKNADINAKATDGKTPLMFAAESGKLDVVNTLLANHADVNATDKDGSMPLLLAARNGHLDVVNTLLANHADVNATDKDGSTPLLLATRNGHLDVVSTLLVNHADVNAKDKDGSTPLLSAAQRGHADIAKSLLNKGADVNAKDMYGNTPLLSAAQRGDDEIAKSLLNNGADVNAKDRHDNTPLLLALHNRELDVINTLLANHADVNASNRDGQTPLLMAVLWGKLDVVDMMLANNADVNAKDKDGNTPLLSAANKGQAEVAKSLLNKGADVNAKNRYGYTPLLSAASNRKPGLELINMLLANNADVFAKNEYGNTALMIAERFGNGKIAEVLRAKTKEHSQNEMNSLPATSKPMAYSYQRENATPFTEIEKETDKPRHVDQQKPKI